MSNQSKNSISNQSSAFSSLQTYRKAMTQVDVEISPSEVFSDAAKYVIQSANRVFRESLNAPIVEEALLTKYFVDALVYRVAITSGQQVSSVMRGRQRFYPLPAVVYNAIRQIGEATDQGYRVRFVPTLNLESVAGYNYSSYKEGDKVVRGAAVESIGKYQFLCDEDFEKVTNMLVAMEDQGYTMSESLSRDVYGDVNFMAMTNVENQTNGPESYKGQNPVYAFYRSFFYNKRLESLADSMFTYKYNNMDEMNYCLRDIVIRNLGVKPLDDVMREFR